MRKSYVILLYVLILLLGAIGVSTLVWSDIQENTISQEYYNRDNYPEFFEEDWHSWNIDNLDIKRISYLILRTHNVERMFEGAIDNLATSGTYLKLVKRIKQLKDNKQLSFYMLFDKILCVKILIDE